MASWVTLARVVTGRVYREAKAENLTFMAGSIAYHAFVSLLPFLVLVVVLVTAFGDETLADQVVALAASYFTPSTRTVVTDTITVSPESATVSALGIAVLLWGTLKIFRSLDQAFSDIYESSSQNTVLNQFVDGTIALVAVGLAVLGAATAGAVLRYSFGPLTAVVNQALLTTGLFLGFLPIYYLFPDEDVTLYEIVPGTLFAAVGWSALRVGYRYYVEVSSAAETYGLAGGILLLVTWLYFSGFVLLLGAALNAVLAGRSEDVAPIDWANPTGDGDPTPVASDADLPDVEDVAALVGGAIGDRHADAVTLTVDGETVTLPAPAGVTPKTETVRRPAMLGGDRAEAELVLRWESSGTGANAGEAGSGGSSPAEEPSGESGTTGRREVSEASR